MQRCIRLLVLLLALVLCCPCSSAESQAERYEQAQILLSEGLYGAAADLLSGISGYGDASMLCMYARALEQAENGEYDTALQSLAALDDFRDSRLQAAYYTGRRYEAMGLADQALETYRAIAAFRDCLARIQALSSVPAPTEASEYWPEHVSEEQLRSAEWLLDPADEAMDGLSMLSVSPSGRYVAAVDPFGVDISFRHAADVPNPLGRLPSAIFLFARQEDGYRLDRTIPLDRDTLLELSSLLGGGGALAWSEDETRVAISADWSASSNALTYAHQFHTNLYLLELADGTFRRLTENSRPGEHSVMPQWVGNDTLRYVRMSCDGDWKNVLWELSVETGGERRLADLYSNAGKVSPVLCWQVSGDAVYYTLDSVGGQSGFFASSLSGAEVEARCLIDVQADLRATNRHPYCGPAALYRLEVSADGKWACLSINDLRVVNRDFPLSDDPETPQADPANAISGKTGTPWVPCHNVLLYDLETGRLVDPFVDESLAPTKVVVTGACFAPDGQSLLCALFGDGGPWRFDDYTRTTFCQVSLTDGRFTPVRVLETELDSSMQFLQGISWLKTNALCIPTCRPPLTPIQLFRPSAFLQYPEAGPFSSARFASAAALGKDEGK